MKTIQEWLEENDPEMLKEFFGLFKKPEPTVEPAKEKSSPRAFCPFCKGNIAQIVYDDAKYPQVVQYWHCAGCHKEWHINSGETPDAFDKGYGLTRLPTEGWWMGSEKERLEWRQLAGLISEDEQQDPTQGLMQYVLGRKDQMKHYRKFAKVKARQSQGGEQIQTKIDGKDETDVRTTNPGDWVVSNIEAQGEQQIVDDKTFRKRYDTQNPQGDIYSPSNAEFFGLPYDGSLGASLTIRPPNWGGGTQNLTTGYMVGGPDPNNLQKDFYGIDPKSFQATYRQA